MVVLPTDEVWVHLNSLSADQMVSTEIVVREVPSLLVTVKLVAVTAPSAMEPEVAVSELKTVLCPVLVSVPVTVRTRAQRVVLCVTEPETTSVSKPLLLLWRETVLLDPLIVTVPVPAVNVVPVPEVSQLPETDHAPLVIVIVPPVGEVLVTLPTVP